MASVTVMVPTYEREGLLREALDSALAQTFDDFVILVGDNSESDAVERLVATYDDPRISYHRNRPSLSPQGNWLDLAARAQTPLVASLHDDDVWDPGFLAATVPPMLANPDLGMTFTDFWMIDGDSRRLDELTESESARTQRAHLPAGPLHYDLAHGLRLVAVWNAPQPAYAAVLRRDDVLAAEFPSDTEPLYDIWLSYDLIKRGRGLHYVPQRLTSYRVHPGSGTSAGFGRAEDAVFRRILAEQGAPNPTDQALAEVRDEVAAQWGWLQWARGTRLMTQAGADPEARAQSRHELGAAARGLRGPRRAVAWAASHLPPVWHALRLGRTAVHRLRSHRDPRVAS